MFTFMNCLIAFVGFFGGVSFLFILIDKYPLIFYHKFLKEAIKRKATEVMLDVWNEMEDE